MSDSWSSIVNNIKLHNAFERRDFPLVINLINTGCSVNSQNTSGKTPLHIALNELNVTCSRDEETRRNRKQIMNIIDILLHKGASVNIQDCYGDTPLHVYVSGAARAVGLIQKLFEKGALENIKNKRGLTPFHIAVSKGYKEDIEPMFFLGAEVETKTEDGQTPLHLAVEHYNCILSEVLLDRGAKANTKDAESRTPLHIAVSKEHLTMSELLLARGASVNVRDSEGKTPLHFAAGLWNWRLVDLLLQNNAQVNIQDNRGKTPLHVAVINQDNKIINMLLNRRALTSIADTEGKTPVCLAVLLSDNERLVERMLRFGVDAVGAYQAYLALLADYYKTEEKMLTCIHKLQELGICRESSLKKLCQQLTEHCDISFYDVIYGRISLLTNPQMIKCLEVSLKNLKKALTNSKFSNEFTFWFLMLRAKFARTRQRLIFLNKAQIFFDISIHFNLPTIFTTNVLRHLSDCDLQNLIVICEETTKSVRKAVGLR